jgi:SAM-dependent methyltransferase
VYVQSLLGGGKDVLDIGCGEGFFAEKLAAAGHRVTGVDVLERPDRPHAFTDYHSVELDSSQAETLLGALPGRFDYVLLLDVLEHLKNPERILSAASRLLKPGGRLIISLPNVANLTVRLALLFGRFDYAERGILDRTHLHFYTRRTVKSLLARNGLRSLEEKITVMPLELVLGLSPRSPAMRAISAVLGAVTRLLPGLFGYQILHVASPVQSEAHQAQPDTAADLLRLADNLAVSPAAELSRTSHSRVPSGD